MLIVEGDLKAKKGIDWTGLIIAAGESDDFDDDDFETKEKVDLKDGTILGAVLVGGTKVKVKTKKLDLLYSEEVVSQAMKLIMANDEFTVTGWFE